MSKASPLEISHVAGAVPLQATCTKCKEHRQKIEDLEGALAGAHNTIRQLRDRDSVVKEEK